jgi:hypothetical protein
MKPSIFQNKIIANHDVENMIETQHAKIKAVAYNDGKYNGMKEPALPLTNGEKLTNYISFKSTYEHLALKVLQILQPASQFAEGKIDSDLAYNQNKRLTDEVEKLQKQTNILKRELGQYDPSDIASRIKKTNLTSVGLFIGEVALNTQAFQVTGENLLSSLILSASVSLAVCLGAHFAGRKYKDARTKLEKRLIVILSAIGIVAVSSVIASLRTIFLQKIGVDINPLYFTIFNIVFFIIAALTTWYLYPTNEEIEENKDHLKKYTLILKLEKEKKQKEIEMQEHEKTSKEKLKEHLRTIMYAEYAIERIKILYKESVDIWKGANRLGRKDNPDYLNDEIPSLDIPNINFKLIINKYKDYEDKNNSAS